MQRNLPRQLVQWEISLKKYPNRSNVLFRACGMLLSLLFNILHVVAVLFHVLHAGEQLVRRDLHKEGTAIARCSSYMKTVTCRCSCTVRTDKLMWSTVFLM